MTPRKRTGLPSGFATTLGQKLMFVIALGLIYGGAVALALAAGVTGGDLDRVTGAAWLQDELASIDLAAWSQATTIGVGVGGVVLAAVFVRLAWAQRLVPQRTRLSHELETDGAGRTTVQPRAIERAAELASTEDPGVRAAKATLSADEITVHLHVRDAARLPDLLRAAKSRTQAALEAAGLADDVAVRLTVTRYSTPSRTELLR